MENLNDILLKTILEKLESIDGVISNIFGVTINKNAQNELQDTQCFDFELRQLLQDEIRELKTKKDNIIINMLISNVSKILIPVVDNMMNLSNMWKADLNIKIKKEINKYKYLTYGFLGLSIILFLTSTLIYKKYDNARVNDLKYRYLRILPISNTANLTQKIDSVFRTNDFIKLEKAISEKENAK